MRLFRIFVCSILLNTALYAAEPKPIELSTRVMVAHSGGAFNFLIRIEPHAENRAWCLELDGERFYRGSCLPITDGLKEAVYRQVLIGGVPGGVYEARALVCRTVERDILEDGCRDAKRVKITVRVIGGPEDPEIEDRPGPGMGEIP